MTTYTREQLETLQPLRLPNAGEDRGAFESELDARLASLALLAELSPTECVGLALWLGKDGWQAFAVDVSDCEGNPTAVEFSRNLRMGETIYDEAGNLRHKTDAERAKAVRVTMGETHMTPTAESTLRKDVNTYRNAAFPERSRAEQLLLAAAAYENPLLKTSPAHQALFLGSDSELPVWRVKQSRRVQLQRELRQSAARLDSSVAD